MKKLKVAFKIFAAIFLGLLFSIYVIQNHKEFKGLAEQHFASIANKDFNYNLNSSIQTIKLFWPFMQFKNMHVNKKGSNNWKWQSRNFDLSYSWLELLINQRLQLSMHVDKLDATSLLIDGKPAIIDHFRELFLSPKFFVPVDIKNFSIKDCRFNFLEPSSGLDSFVRYGVDLKEQPDYFKSNIFFKDGALAINQLELFKNLGGSIHMQLPRKNVPAKLSADLSFQIPTTIPRDCFISGKFYNRQGDFALHTLDDELIITPITITTKKNGLDFSAQGQMPISYLDSLFFGISALDLSGECQFSTYANIGKNTELHGHMAIKDLIIGSLKTKIDEAKFFFKRKQNRCKYNFFLSTPNKLELTGNLTWNEKTKRGTICIENPDDVWLLNNKISKDDLKIDINFTENNMTGKYNCNVLVGGKPTKIEGKIIANKKVLKAIGMFGDIQTEIHIGLKPKAYIKNIIFKKPKGKLVDINTSPTSCGQKICTQLEISEAKKLLPPHISNLISGKGIVAINGCLEGNVFKGTVEVKDGNIIILNAYNIIKKLKADVVCNTKDKTLTLTNTVIQLDKGKITNSSAMFELDENNNISFAYMPVLFNDCFLSWNNVFGTVSGRALISKQAGVGKISGKVVLDSSKIRNNIFSSEFGPGTFNSKGLDNWHANIILQSKSPIKVKTPMLDCLAKLDLKIKGNINQPDIDGQINLLEGKIFFPYKPLTIVNANMLFISGTQLDPIIELTAKAKLRNYLVSMFVTGSASNSQIRLVSVPDLTEEQIGSLLLAGSENASLNLIVPTLVMQNLRNIIFGSIQAQDKLNKYFKRILKPLKHIRFVPTFVDETGRGGFRGGIEIDVSDRLHALIQKNFSMPEDTKFEVDYQITDDVSLRAIKDERGDLGGELEMRWKF